MRALPVFALCALALLPAARPAAAQLPDTPLPIRIKAGALLPSSGDTKNQTNDFHLAAEVDLTLPFAIPFGGNIVSLGYSDNVSGDRKLRTIPLTLGTISSPPNPASGATGNIYYGGGIGLYFLRVSGGGLPSKDGARFGGYLTIGYQTPTSLFLEAKYITTGEVDGLKPNGFAFYIGTRL